MTRGGRVVYKRSNRRKKRKPRSNGGGDDDDEEYVLGEDEDEESESNYELDADSRDLSDEDSFEFSESDADREIEIVRLKKTTMNKQQQKKQRSRKKTRVSDDEMEDLSVPKKRGRGRPRPRRRRRESRDSDYELDDEEDEDDEDFSPDDDDFDEDEDEDEDEVSVSIGTKRKGGVRNLGKKARSEIPKKKGRKKKQKNVASLARKRQKRRIENSDDDDDFIVKDRVSVSVGRKKKSKNVRKWRATVDSDSVSDFLTSDDDDFVEKSIVVMNNKKVKNTSGSKGRRKKRSIELSESSDSDYVISDDCDDNFDANDQIVIDKRQKKNKKETNLVVSNRRKRRKLLVDSDSLDSDYLMSDDDDDDDDDDDVEHDVEDEDEDNDDFVVEDKLVTDKQHKKTNRTRKKRMEPKTRRKRSSSLVNSDLELLDINNEISEEEVKDLRVGWGFEWPKPKRLVMKKKEEEKGKEKKVDDSGKQVCGICLSEEQNGVVRGLLDCCSHYFCFACIMEWSKVESRCPVCKRRFVTITKSGKLNPGFGIRNSVIRVQKKDQVYQPSEEELRGMLDPYENVVCMECHQGVDDNLMLLCDICDSSAHTYCVGLGREVPEGNWYCECCRSVNDVLSHSQTQDTVTSEGAHPSYLNSIVTERGGLTNARVGTNSPRPVSTSGRPPSLRIDLNSSPRDFPGDDNYVASPMSGSGASTLSGRRHIQQRIRILLSTNRQRQPLTRTSMLRPGTEADVVTPEDARNEEALPSILNFEDWQQNRRPFFHSNTNLVPCMFNEGSSFRHVEGAKEEVQTLVKKHLKNLARDVTLDRTTLKEIMKNSTHTILAACGIDHQRSNVLISVEPPDYCPHDSDDGPTHLVKGCCSSCFNSFVEDVMQRLVDMSR